MDESLAAEISRAVKAIHPEMAWEMGAGRSGRHQFCLSLEGRPEVRQLALRWLESAPAADAEWEFYAARQANDEMLTLVFSDAHLDLAEMRAIASWDQFRRRIDVKLWHPLFDRLPDGHRMQAAFLFLDGLLGEDDVERWIGDIEALADPIGGRTPQELRAEADRYRLEPAEEGSWIVAEGEGPEGSTVVLADAALRRIDHPFADHHVAIEFGVDDLTDEVLPQLESAEEDLSARLEGLATYAGRVTTPRRRTVHLVTEDPASTRAVIDEWRRQLRQQKITVDVHKDMEWRFQEQLGVR